MSSGSSTNSAIPLTSRELPSFTSHARRSSNVVPAATSGKQRKASDSSEASSSSHVTAITNVRGPSHPYGNPVAAASASSIASSQRTVSRNAHDLPFRHANSPSIASNNSAAPGSRLRQHSQGFFEPSLPSQSNLPASAIAAQAAMHVQHQSHMQASANQQTLRRRSQNAPEPLTLNRPFPPRKGSSPLPPLHTAPLPSSDSSSSASQTRNNSIADSRGAATFAANAAFPRSAVQSPETPQTPQGQITSPSSYFERERETPKPQKKESRMKIFSKPRQMYMRDKDAEKKGSSSPKSIYGGASSKVSQSSVSLADSMMSSGGASSFYSSTNASSSTLTATDKSGAGADKEKHKHQHFLSRQKQKIRENIESHHLPLSSASSNSRPVDPSAPQPLYSFAPSSPGFGSKSISGFDLRHGGKALREKRKEEKAAAAASNNFVAPAHSQGSVHDVGGNRQGDSSLAQPSDSFGPSSTSTFTSQMSTELGLPAPSLGAFGLQGMGADDAWPLLKARLLNIFEGEDLRTPIEDFNRLLSIHLRACIQSRAPGMVIQDLRELLLTGFLSLDHTLRSVPEELLVSHLVEMWQFVFGTILPFIQAVFLPLDQEFKGQGPILSSRDAADFWASALPATHRPSIVTITPETSMVVKPLALDVRTMVLQTFRDTIIVPRHEKLLAIFSRLSLESINNAAAHTSDSQRPGTASSGSASNGYSNSMPGSFDPSSLNSQVSTYLDSASIGARSRATSNTSAGSFHSISSTRPSAQRHARNASGSHTPQMLVVDSARVTQTAARMLQCISVLASLSAGHGFVTSTPADTDDDAIAADPEIATRRKMERLAAELKLNWLGRGRTGRNRRGLVGTKPARRDVDVSA